MWEETSQRPADRIAVTAGRLDEAEATGSRSQLGRVLGNLLDNAQRHAAAAVRVEVVRNGAEAVLRVDDDGPGVPPGDRERIFERFVRLGDARARDRRGPPGAGPRSRAASPVPRSGGWTAAGGLRGRRGAPAAGRRPAPARSAAAPGPRG
ncbi:ATP-binding protein [Streptomyces sp. NPDC059080]|uniref:ATP-binding protein n=1 Tax=Streptomyces sp. NPDC059080 TaxID=3346718 RepID=UPI0036C29345